MIVMMEVMMVEVMVMVMVIIIMMIKALSVFTSSMTHYYRSTAR